MGFSVSCRRCGWEEFTKGSDPGSDECPVCGSRQLRVLDEYLGEYTQESTEQEPSTTGASDGTECLGRESELGQLNRWFLGEAKKRVVLWGPPGAGKTVLAHRFAENYRAAAGSVVLFSPSLRDDLFEEVAVANLGRRDLAIVDDVLAPAVDAFLDRIAIEMGDTRVLVLARERPSSGAMDAGLELGGLSAATITVLLERAGLSSVRSASSAEVIQQRLAGHPLVVWTVTHLLSRGIPIDQILRDLEPFEHSGADADPAFAIAAVRDSAERLYELVSRKPEMLHTLTPRQFEEVVAEILARDGYDVQLTPIARDGGKDIYAARKDRIGKFLYIVECKKFAPDRAVGVGYVRSLHGVVMAESATAGILVTTSYFTKPAREFEDTVRYKLSLQDYSDVSRWLHTAFD